MNPRVLPPLKVGPLLWGSIAPDIPLILLAAGFIIYDLTQGNFGPPGPDGPGAASATGYLFDTLFFQAWWVKGLHNLFHAPLMDLGYMAIGYWAWKKDKAWGAGLFWFAAAALLHTLIDIPVHFDDGPLLLFPFNWDLRYYSPVSYWDPNRFGREFTIFEHTLIGLLLVWLIWDWFKNRRKAAKSS